MKNKKCKLKNEKWKIKNENWKMANEIKVVKNSQEKNKIKYLINILQMRK